MWPKCGNRNHEAKERIVTFCPWSPSGPLAPAGPCGPVKPGPPSAPLGPGGPGTPGKPYVKHRDCYFYVSVVVRMNSGAESVN